MKIMEMDPVCIEIQFIQWTGVLWHSKYLY